MTRVAASVLARLNNQARAAGADVNLLLQRYVAERFLYRLGVSAEVDRFTLKGAALFLVWSGRLFRPTKDLDLLGSLAGDHATIGAAMRRIAAIHDPHDGVAFQVDAISIDEIREEQAYGGVRVHLPARLGNARLALPIDIGFGDTIHPSRKAVDYPTLLDHAPPHIWAYPRETMIAEKFEAMVRYGAANSRMKDFWDIVVLAREFAFDADTLRTAIDETFRRRGTVLGEELPEVLTPAFYGDQRRADMWRLFAAKGGSVGASMHFSGAGAKVASFLGPLLQAPTGREVSMWAPGGPWK